MTFLSFYSLEKPLKPLAELNLPPAVIACYQRSGISHLFAWQAECLERASASGEYIHLFQFHLNKFLFLYRKTKFHLFRTRFICFKTFYFHQILFVL
jgi:hypothetical protein